MVTRRSLTLICNISSRWASRRNIPPDQGDLDLQPAGGDGFAIGAFPAPVPEEGADCFINDHMDVGMGMNADTQHPEVERLFLEWLGSAELRTLMESQLLRTSKFETGLTGHMRKTDN